MRLYHFIVVLFLLLTSILLSACQDPGTVMPGTVMNDTSPGTLKVNVGIIEDQNAINGKSLLTFQ